jgi:tRNA threonylcarbamoyladenosine biosynthesis protein TsaB
MTQLSIDTASDLASIALSQEGVVFAERSWQCRRNHTVELLAGIDGLLREAGVEAGASNYQKEGGLAAVFVSIGPGMYTGLRVGISIGQGLARGLGLPLVGVGRLELDAWPHREFDGEVIAVHRAGRGELAWASYRLGREVSAPSLAKPDELVGRIDGPTLVVGEVDEALATLLQAGAPVEIVTDEVPRARALAVLGNERLLAGGEHEPALVRPVYLRSPVIGPLGSSQ